MFETIDLEKVDIPFDQNALDNYGGDKISFSVGGENFSTPKIKRRIEQGDSMYEAIFYGKKVTEEEYKKILAVLVPKEGSK